MSSTENINNHLKLLSLSKFNLLTDTKYKEKKENKKQKIKNIYTNTQFLISKKSILPKSNIIRKKNKNNPIYSFENIKDYSKTNKCFSNKNSLSPNRFNKNIKSRNQYLINNEIKTFLFNENNKMFYSEDNELKCDKSSKDSLPILKDFNSLNNLFIQKDYKKKLDNKIINILRTELLNAKTSVNLRNTNLKLKLKKKIFKNNPSMDYTKSNLNIKNSNNIEKKEKKIQLNLFSKIKLYYTPPFFEINSNATKKSIINDTKIMTGFEKYNFSKIE